MKTSITHVREVCLWIHTGKPFVLVPNTVHDQVRTLSIVRGSAQSTEYSVVKRVFVGHLEHRWNHHVLALLSEVFRAAQNAAEILRSAVNGVIHHHFPTVRETRHHLCREINLISVSVFRLQGFSFL